MAEHGERERNLNMASFSVCEILLEFRKRGGTAAAAASVGIMRLMDRGKPCARAATTPTKIPTTWNRQGCHPSCLACGRGCGTIFSLDCVYQSKHQQLLNNSWDFVSVYFKERGREGAGSFLHRSIPSSRVASVVWFSSSLSLSLLSFSRAPDFSSRPIQ